EDVGSHRGNSSSDARAGQWNAVAGAGVGARPRDRRAGEERGGRAVAAGARQHGGAAEACRRRASDARSARAADAGERADRRGVADDAGDRAGERRDCPRVRRHGAEPGEQRPRLRGRGAKVPVFGGRLNRRTEIVVLAVIVLAAAILILATQPLDVFWGSDSGNRFIQLQSFLRTGGVAIDRAPHIGHHFVAVRGKDYSFYDPIFPLASAPLYAALGLPGLFILPIAGTLLLIALLPLLTSASPLRVGLLVVFATPIFWYTVVFWEHTIAAGLAIAAVALAKRERFLTAGALAGL